MFCCVEFELWKYPHCGDISESISSYADAAIERSLNISPILVKDGKSLETLSNEKKQDFHFCTNFFFFFYKRTVHDGWWSSTQNSGPVVHEKIILNINVFIYSFLLLLFFNPSPSTVWYDTLLCSYLNVLMHFIWDSLCKSEYIIQKSLWHISWLSFEDLKSTTVEELGCHQVVVLYSTER